MIPERRTGAYPLSLNRIPLSLSLSGVMYYYDCFLVSHSKAFRVLLTGGGSLIETERTVRNGESKDDWEERYLE